ncbi:MAG: molecular chaperone DnaJ [Caldisericia bacterium]|nr:molecular chaperone DnaJ [Caldisericia bacterium]
MAKKDYYEILGVERSSTPEAIKSSYRKLVMKYHPDVNKDSDASQKMTEINEAYNALSDPKKKQQYDMYGDTGVGGSQGFGGAGFGENQQGNMNDFFRQSGFGGGTGSIFDDIFGAFTGGGGRQRNYRPKPMGRPGGDISFSTNITYLEAIQGKTIKIELDRFTKCTDCSGTGSKNGTSPETCSHCKGSGYVQHQEQSIFGMVNSVSECSNCNGTGKIIKDKCPTCRGFGRIKKKTTIELNIPPTVSDGTNIRYQGYGNAGINGGALGDLILNIRYKVDTRFKRHQSTLVYDNIISFTKAILGTVVSIPTIEGSERIKILPGTQSGKEVLLRGKGLPNSRRRRGDIIVRIIVDIPTVNKLNRKQKKSIEELDASLK